jgi:hypothetical protein
MLANIVSLITYAAGAYIIYRIGPWWLIPYLLYIIWLEVRLLVKSCPGCFYYGSVCAFGKGKVSSIFFKRGNPAEFINAKVTWFSILPDMLVSVVPIIAAIVMLIKDFDWVLLGVMLLLIILVSLGNSLVRGSLACKYCRQRELGCPALQLFEKKA